MQIASPNFSNLIRTHPRFVQKETNEDKKQGILSTLTIKNHTKAVFLHKIHPKRINKKIEKTLDLKNTHMKFTALEEKLT